MKTKSIISLFLATLILTGCTTTVGVYDPMPPTYIEEPYPIIIVPNYHYNYHYFPHHFPSHFNHHRR